MCVVKCVETVITFFHFTIKTYIHACVYACACACVYVNKVSVVLSVWCVVWRCCTPERLLDSISEQVAKRVSSWWFFKWNPASIS